MPALFPVLIFVFSIFNSSLLQAQHAFPTSAKAVSIEPRYIARIELNTADELKDALHRAQALSDAENPERPVAFVLHGDEVYSLLNENRSDHLDLFSLAEELSLKKVVSIKVCSSWLAWQRLNNAQLPPFVGQVEFAPTEINRLIEQEGYTYF
jgi:intracellular sulfur oxidation DsrE/DsrF family protein